MEKKKGIRKTTYETTAVLQIRGNISNQSSFSELERIKRSEYILKVEFIELTNKFQVEGQRKKDIKNNYLLSGLNGKDMGSDD